jgi:DNA-binding GntR family transcriptional regulator
MPRSAPRKLLRDDIYARIKEGVLSCEIPPGTEIRGQELADSFGVSMSPVRDALHRLQTEGLIEVLPRQGYYVRKISLEDALELYEMRIILESACVERTVRAASDADLAALDPYSRGPTAGSRREWTAHNKEFHLFLASLCGNSRLISTTQEIILAFDRLTLASISQPYGAGSRGSTALAALDHEHSEIITALKERDAALAVQLMRAHIERSRTRFLESYNSPQTT